MALHVIVGNGPVGSATAALLADAGHTVRVITRSGKPANADPRIDYRALDATDTDRLARAAHGAAALYNCANPQYHRWPIDWPPIAAALLAAAQRTGAVLVTASNLYGYGPVGGPLTEDLPLASTGTKGMVRAAMWRDALAAHAAGRVRATEVRASV
jgi:nucleoside-diphosphate-sugar epimerase